MVIKDFRLICLTSFCLKTLEKLVDIYLREGPFMEHPLNLNQYAYQAGRSTESALHSAISLIEGFFERKGFVVRVLG